MQRSIFFKPAYQTENTGDLLINKSMIALLQDYGEVIVDDNNKPDWFVSELITGRAIRLSDITKRSLYSYLFSQYKVGNKNKCYFVYPPGHSSRKGIKALSVMIKDYIKLLFLNIIDCKVIRIGFTIGPFDKPNLMIEKMRASLHTVYGVRDSKSYDLAQRNKFKNLDFFPDLAWAYRPTQQNRIKRTVALSFRSNSYGTSHDINYFNPILDRIKDLLSSITDFNCRVKIFYQVKYDRDSSIALYKALIAEGVYDVELIDKKLSLQDANDLYSESIFVISNRLHVLLLALHHSCLPIGLINYADNKKITGIFEDNGLQGLLLDYEQASEANLTKFLKIIEDMKNISSTLSETCEKNTEIMRNKLSVIFK